MPESPALLEITDVKKSFKDTEAVKGVSLTVNSGEYIALLGPNGAGKTTLVEMIEGIQLPTSGSIRINGYTWQENKRALRESIGLSLQETHFIDKLKVRETLELFASFYKLDSIPVDSLLEMVSLHQKQHSFVANLSGGQRQRLALGLALINKPQLLLLDEPTTGLDPVSRRQIWKILMDIKNTLNTSLILTTHYMEEAEFLCDRIIILDQGKILEQGTLEELHHKNGSTEILKFSLEEEVSQLDLPAKGLRMKADFLEKDKSFVAEVTSLPDYLPGFMEFIKQGGYKLNSLQSRKKNLDDLFISLTGRHLQE